MITQNKEICWNITARCNHGCRYCHRFLGVSELSFEKNKKILHNLINSGVVELTWTGGEPLLYTDIEQLMKIAHSNGIKNKLVTNGSLLAIDRLDTICNYLDSITLSIDSIDLEINTKLGRGRDHFKKIDTILNYLQKTKKHIKTGINTVISFYNYGIKIINDLAAYLSKFNIDSWRIFMFMPLREMAARNNNEFRISNNIFDKIKKYVIKNCKVKKIEFRKKKDMESKYVLILANGDIFVTNKGKDVRVGNALFDSINKYLD